MAQEVGDTKGAFCFDCEGKHAPVSEASIATSPPGSAGRIDQRRGSADASVDASRRLGQCCCNDPNSRVGTHLCAEPTLIGAEIPKLFVGWIDKVGRPLEEAQRRK